MEKYSELKGDCLIMPFNSLISIEYIISDYFYSIYITLSGFLNLKLKSFMLILDTILKLILSFLPALLYLSIIYLTIPYGIISIKKMFYYFFSGIISIGLIWVFLFFFHYVQDPIITLVPIFGDDDTRFIMAFIQIALLEETFKYFGVKVGNITNKDITPLSIMIYSGIVALGFSFAENLQYAILYGSEVLVVRSIFTMLLHFICGLIMGYWIGLGMIEPEKTRSIMGVILKKFHLRKIAFACAGIFFAASIHGIFDYNIFLNSLSSNAIEVLIIMMGVLVTYICSQDLIRREQLS